MSGTVLAVSTRALLDACAALGADADAIAARAGVDRAKLRDPSARVPRASVTAVWGTAYAATRDPALALRAAEAAPDDAYPVFDYLGAASATLGEAIERLSRYFALLGDIALRIEMGDEAHRIVLESTVPGASLPLPAQEYTLTALLVRTRRRCGIAWSPTFVDLAAPGPFGSEHARVFGVMPSGDRARPAMGITRVDWETPCVHADAGLASLLEEHARTELSRVPRGAETAQRVTDVVRRTLEQGQPSLALVARRLATSVRTLQRRLDEEGTSLAAIVREERERIARAQLARRDVSLAEVAFLLGFSDQSAFTRAFRRWTGTTPAQFRSERWAARA